MKHNPNGRFGPARCAECNTPLGPDDDQLAKLCRECHDLQIQQDEIFEVRDETNLLK